MSDWTRQEAIQLSGLSKGQFEILERQGLLNPIKIGSKRKPTVMYTNDQLICIRACAKLREWFTLQLLKEALGDFLNSSKPKPNQRLLAWEKQLMWINDNPKEFYEALINADNGKFLTSFTFEDIIKDLATDGAELVDFQERLAIA